jgi:SNF2-related domain/Helicase conserved C-terminal domain
MRLTFEPTTNAFIAETSYEERGLPKAAGFWWDPDGKKSGRPRCWFTRDPAHATKLLPYADVAVLERLGQWDADARQSVLQSRAVDTTLEIPLPPGKRLYGFQRAGVAYALRRKGTLLAPEMGLGKTVITVALSNCVPAIQKVLIVCPMTMREAWRRHWVAWSTKRMIVGIGDADRLPIRADVVILHFDVLHKWKRTLDREVWDLLVVDEAHKIKNPHALRSEQIFGRRKRTVPAKVAKRTSPSGQTYYEDVPAKELAALPALQVRHHALLLTGTPICNRPKEVFPLIHFLAPDHWPQKAAFESRYCAAKSTTWGYSANGHDHLAELQQRLRGTVMYRVLKKDVLTELPAKLRQVVLLPAPDDIKALLVAEQATYEGAQSEEYKAWLTELRAQVTAARAQTDVAAYRAAVETLGEAMSAPLAQLARLRAQLAERKVPFVRAHLTDLLEDNDDKVVCFAHHLTLIHQLAEAFGDDAVVIEGDTKAADRIAAVDRFQHDPTCRLFLGSLTAAGIGITLTASSHVVFAELDWVPGTVIQAEDRCHRIGQKDNVLVEHLLFADSLDAKMARDLIEKQDVIDQALDDIAVIATTMVDDLRTVLSDCCQYEVSESATEWTCKSCGARKQKIATRREAPPPSPARKTSQEIKAALDVEAGGLTAAQTAAVHEALRYLSAACDGARAKDGSGFNKFDAPLGKDLASRASLTPRQAALGRRVLRKYQAQLPVTVRAQLFD